MKNSATKRIVRSAVIAAIYIVLTLSFLPLSYGPFRFSEALTILPLFCPEAIVGLSVGCFISNFFSPNVIILELILGTLGTIISSIMTYFFGKLIKSHLRVVVGILPPIIVNALLVPFTFVPIHQLKELYFMQALLIAGGQTVVLVGIGIPLYFLLYKIKDKIF